MGEIEYFCDPQDLTHKKFKNVAGDILPLYSAGSQDSGENIVIRDVTLGEAIDSGLISN